MGQRFWGFRVEIARNSRGEGECASPCLRASQNLHRSYIESLTLFRTESDILMKELVQTRFSKALSHTHFLIWKLSKWLIHVAPSHDPWCSLSAQA